MKKKENLKKKNIIFIIKIDKIDKEVSKSFFNFFKGQTEIEISDN